MARYSSQEALPSFTTSAPREVYGVLQQAADGDLILWLLANVGFKDADVGRMRQEFALLSSVQVKILTPNGRNVKAVHLCGRGAACLPP
jgi:hypothetical protein